MSGDLRVDRVAQYSSIAKLNNFYFTCWSKSAQNIGRGM